ncbi:MAG: hypothetical protein FJ104_16625, partial [Deltaproteobacteria bacterium]|nr:hypothetical protein [Deltaproteobacteria bacterium]
MRAFSVASLVSFVSFFAACSPSPEGGGAAGGVGAGGAPFTGGFTGSGGVGTGLAGGT